MRKVVLYRGEEGSVIADYCIEVSPCDTELIYSMALCIDLVLIIDSLLNMAMVYSKGALYSLSRKIHLSCLHQHKCIKLCHIGACY